MSYKYVLYIFSGYTNMWHNFSFASLNELTEQVNCFYFSKVCYWQLLHNQQILWQENVTIYVLIYCANKCTNINVLYLYQTFFVIPQLAVFLGSMSPFMNESTQTVTESVGVLVQILSGSADQLTFDK